MKRTFLTVAALTALGALALLASAHTSNDSGSAVDTTPTTPTPRKPQAVAPRCATRAEIIALLEKYVKESRTGGGRPAPVTRLHIPSDGTGRKDAWFYRMTLDQQVWFIIVLYEQYDLSHGQISNLVPLSARAISRILRDAGAVRYSDRPTTPGNTLAA